MPKKLEIYFVRHGESIANTQQLVTGDHYDPLSEKGRKQAQALKSYCQSLFTDPTFHFAKAWTSPFRRAAETAEIAFPNITFNVDARLSETDAGTYKNIPLVEFKEKFPDFWAPFNPARKFPEGESHDDLSNRVIDWVEEQIEHCNDQEKLLVVAHSGSLSALLQWAFQVPMQQFPAFLAANASLSILDIQSAEKKQRIAKLRLFSGSSVTL